MQEPIDTSKVPDSINTRMDSADKAVAALLMKFHAIKDGSTLVRFCLRAALREASAIPGSSLAMTIEAHQPIEPR